MGLSLPCHKLDRRRIRSYNSLSRFAGKPDELRRTNTAALNREQQERKVPPIANPKKRRCLSYPTRSPSLHPKNDPCRSGVALRRRRRFSVGMTLSFVLRWASVTQSL